MMCTVRCSWVKCNKPMTDIAYPTVPYAVQSPWNMAT